MGANELGEVPVLMYHRLLEDGGGDYDLTPEEFRTELEYLATNGYVPITAAELVSGELDVPAGRTPVVLTFDDSTREQFALTEDGEVDPDTAVGILLDVAAEHDDFPATGTFYVLGSLFGVAEDAGTELLRALHDLGFELGNHTFAHGNLGQLDDDQVQRDLAEGARNITEAVPGAEVTTLSYPFGIRPDDPSLVASGSHDGYDYRHEAGFLVGSGPAPSPFSSEFDPLAIPRIRAQPTWDGEADYGSGFWWDVLERAPERRYVSDGDPTTITFPEELADELDDAFTDRAQPY
ncbi:polysaccharide deacetylase family protein [Nitriliruptoraceae bacterium ZYF776]|nr:polysaccharide deacetylase family protein [Profundirhabdus halotolerans]